MSQFKKGDRVKVAFACPTAPPMHEHYIGHEGVIEEIYDYQPTIKNVHGQDINNPSGNIKVNFGRHIKYEGGSFMVAYVFSWELEKV